MDAFKSTFSSIKPPTNLWGGSGGQSSTATDKIPDNVIVANNQQSTPQPQTQQPTNQERAIHRINLESIRHNYNEVQTSAAQQQCQVIVVVKGLYLFMYLFVYHNYEIVL